MPIWPLPWRQLAPGSGSGAPIAVTSRSRSRATSTIAPAGGKIEKLTLALGDLTAAGDVSFTPGTPSQAAVKLAINRIDLDALLAQAARQAGGAGRRDRAAGSGRLRPADGNQCGGRYRHRRHQLSRRPDRQHEVRRRIGQWRVRNQAILRPAARRRRGFGRRRPDGRGWQAAGSRRAGSQGGQSAGAAGLAAGRSRRCAGRTAAHPGADQPLHRRRRNLLELADLDLKLDNSSTIPGRRASPCRKGQQKMAFGVGLRSISSISTPICRRRGSCRSCAEAARASGGLPLGQPEAAGRIGRQSGSAASTS